MSILNETDFEGRIAAAREVARRNRLDAIMVFSTECEPAQVRYFADYWPSFETAAVLIPAKGEPALLIGPESLTYASARTKIPNIIQLMDFRESSQPDYPGSKLPMAWGQTPLDQTVASYAKKQRDRVDRACWRRLK